MNEKSLPEAAYNVMLGHLKGVAEQHEMGLVVSEEITADNENTPFHVTFLSPQRDRSIRYSAETRLKAVEYAYKAAFPSS